MKLFQVYKDLIYYEYTGKYVDAADASRHFAPNIEFVDTPDFVFCGWGYDRTKKGDDRFIMPSVGEGQAYNPETGEVWIPEEVRSLERTRLHEATTNDTLQALRKIREGDTSIDWQAWLDALDAYNVAIEETKNQEGYPLRVEYPEYPTKP